VTKPTEPRVYTRRVDDKPALQRAGIIILCAVTHIWDFVDKRQIIRRGAFLWMLWITAKVVFWTLDFAQVSARPGIEVAAIIAAIWAPLATLQGALVRFYDDAQKANQKEVPP
jgi:hypothetical protein